MNQTTRRNAIRLVAAGSATAALAAEHDHKPIKGPLANAVVSFGQWKTPLDRFGVVTPANNNHQLLPFEAKIKAGGSVSFIISGLHLVLVYDDGVKPEDIDTTKLIPGAPPLINDPNHRIYRGLNPITLLPIVDRVEVVHFDKPGMYFVTCGVLPHFRDKMFGYVKVVPNNEGEQDE